MYKSRTDTRWILVAVVVFNAMLLSASRVYAWTAVSDFKCEVGTNCSSFTCLYSSTSGNDHYVCCTGGAMSKKICVQTPGETCLLRNQPIACTGCATSPSACPTPCNTGSSAQNVDHCFGA